MTDNKTNAKPVAWMQTYRNEPNNIAWTKKDLEELGESVDYGYIPLYTTPQTKPLKFPTMLRKMWSGGEVQKWLDENQAPQTKPLSDEEIHKLAQQYFHAGLGINPLDFARAIESKIKEAK